MSSTQTINHQTKTCEAPEGIHDEERGLCYLTKVATQPAIQASLNDKFIPAPANESELTWTKISAAIARESAYIAKESIFGCARAPSGSVNGGDEKNSTVSGGDTKKPAGDSDFVWGPGIEGPWFKVNNNCEDDDTQALVITQSGSNLTFEGSFSDPISDATISGNDISFTITYFDGTTENCQATFTDTILEGNCDDCGSFKYTRVLAEGAYQFAFNRCASDDGSLSISRNGAQVMFSGGFDYQTASPDIFEGSIVADYQAPIQFSIPGPFNDTTIKSVTCGASMRGEIVPPFGSVFFEGDCAVVDDSNNTTNCNFGYDLQ